MVPVIYYVGEFFHNGRGHIVLLKKTHIYSLYEYIHVLFVQELFRLGLSMGFLKLDFLGEIASFERRLQGRLQRPSPCLIRSPPRRERGWGLSETSEKYTNFDILNGNLQLFFGSLCMERLNLARHYFQIGVIFRPKTKSIYCKTNPHGTAVGIIVVHLFIEFR